MKFKGILMEFNKPNGNGRIYREEDFLGKEFNNYYFGELDPNMGNEEYYFPYDPDHINVNNASHKIDNIHIDNGKLIGDIEILNTPYGRIAKNLLNNGMSLYVASRGRGGIDENGVVRDYNLITFDIVSDGAFENAKIEIDKEITTDYKYIMSKKIERLQEKWFELKKDI